MEEPPPRMRGKKLKEQPKKDENTKLSNFPQLPSSCLSSSITIPCATDEQSTTATHHREELEKENSRNEYNQKREDLLNKEFRQKEEDVKMCAPILASKPVISVIPKLIYPDFDTCSPPISPARMLRSKIWLDANVTDLDSSLYFINTGNGVYRIQGTITCTKPNVDTNRDLRMYFETPDIKQIKDVTGDNKVQLTVSTAFSCVGLLVGAIFFDCKYYFSPLKARQDGSFRAMTLDEFEDFVTAVDKSITTNSWCIRVNGLVNMV